MDTQQNQLTIAQPQQVTAFTSIQGFEAAQRMASCLVSSDLVPEQYRGKDKIGNALIALEMSQRIGASPLAVMQNLHVIEGKPSWSSSFIIAALNSCGRFSPIRFRVTDLGPKKVVHEKSWWNKRENKRETKTITIDLSANLQFVAWCYDKATGEVLEGPAATYEMAVREDWWTKPGSKWQTMPELMGRYRAAAFFGRLYAPDVLNGMHTTEEVQDTIEIEAEPVPRAAAVAAINARIAAPQPPAVEVVEAASEPAPAPKKSAAERANAAVKRKPEPTPVQEVAPAQAEESVELLPATPASEIQGAADEDWN